MNYIGALIEIDEFDSDSIKDLLKDNYLIDEIGDVFYGYMDFPSDYSKLLFSSGPYKKNCNIFYYRQFDIGTKDFDVGIRETFSLVLLELKRNGYLYFLDNNQIEMLVKFDENKFPNFDIDSYCQFKISHF